MGAEGCSKKSLHTSWRIYYNIEFSSEIWTTLTARWKTQSKCMLTILWNDDVDKSFPLKCGINSKIQCKDQRLLCDHGQSKGTVAVMWSWRNYTMMVWRSKQNVRGDC